MHIITGPNGLVGPAAKHDFACVRACVHTRVCVRRYMAELVTLITVLILGREE